MIVHQIFAQIYEGMVQNVIVCDNYEMANHLARACYGNEAFSVDCLQYPCGIGDKYRDGVFYRINEEGTEIPIEYVPTQEQQVAQLEAKLFEVEKMVRLVQEEMAFITKLTNPQRALKP